MIRRKFVFVPAMIGIWLLAGCVGGTQIYPTLQQRNISLNAGDLEAYGIGFLTPSATTGQEEEKQAVALVFAEVMQQQRPGVRVVPLAETLGAVNKGAIADAYIRMYNDYRDSGLLKREILQQVGKATGARYLAQIKLQGFGQSAKDRWGTLGFRIVETKSAHLRLFFQIWDSRDGTVAWEATQELHYSQDTFSERQLTLPKVVGRAAKDLVSKLP
jgi:hypothetical protein